MPKLYIMVGLPGSGKSTYVSEHLSDVTYISSDKYIEARAEKLGCSYNDIFKSTIKYAEDLMWQDAFKAHKAKEDVVIDRTNMTKRSRARWLNFFRGWEPHCTVMHCDRVHARNAQRINKTIPMNVINSMKYEAPALEEGFVTISHIIT